MIPTINISDRNKIQELINQAPGNYFGLKGSSGMKLRSANYKEKRDQFLKKAMDYLNGDLAGEGFYTVMSSTNTKIEPLFNIQKGSSSMSAPPIIIQDSTSSDIQLVKENAELKAKLHYLELQLAELQEQLEDSEKELSEAPDPAEKPNPWLSLAEQLAPAAAQIIGALAAKIISPPQYEQSPFRPGTTEQRPMEVRHPRTNAQFNPGAIPGQRSNYSHDLQGDDHPGTSFRDQHTQA